jgi:hypothetical protein
MSEKIKVLESSTIIIDNDYASIDINEDIDNNFKIKINDNYNKLLLGIPYSDDNSILYVQFKDALEVLRNYFHKKEY